MTTLRALVTTAFVFSHFVIVSDRLLAVPLTVAGVTLDEKRDRAGGVSVVLCFAKDNGPQKARDTSSRHGVYSLYVINVDSDLRKVYAIALGDSRYEEAKKLVPVTSSNVLITAKAEDIELVRRLPLAFSFPFLKKEEGVARLAEIEEIQTLLTLNGYRSEKEGREIWEKEAARIMANLDEAGADPRQILMEAKTRVEADIGLKSIIPDDFRTDLLKEGGDYRLLLEKKLDPAIYLKDSKIKMPDDVVDFLVRLPPEKIRLEWLPSDAARNAVLRRMGKSGEQRVIGIFPYGKDIGSKLEFPLIEAKEESLDETLPTWVRNPNVRYSIFLDYLGKQAKNIDANKMREIERTFRPNQLNSMRVIE